MLASNKTNLYKVTTPELPLGGGVAGTGDMTTAVFLSHYLQTKDLEKTLLLSTASVFGILKVSYESTGKSSMPMELKIIAAQQELVSPSHSFNVEQLK
jgi:pyridoxine kinase